MKKFIFFALIFMSIQQADAQYYSGFWCDDCYSSIEVGVVQSNISGLEGASSKTGFHLGIYQFSYISESFSIRYGSSYTNLGANIDGFEEPLIIHGINFPLSVHYMYDYKFQGFLGGELGTNIFGKIPSSTGDSFDQLFDFQEVFTVFDASVFLGVGYILIETIDINLKYNIGVTDINKSVEGPELRKNWLTLSVGYTWRD